MTSAALELNFANLTDNELEKGVLAAATASDQLARQAALVITEQHFSNERARLHWRCICDCLRQAIPVSVTTVATKARSSNLGDQVSLSYLMDADDAIPFVIDGFDGWLRMLDEQRVRRQIVTYAQALQVRACDTGQSLADVLETAKRLGSDIGGELPDAQGFATVGDIVSAAGGTDGFFAPDIAGRALGAGIGSVDSVFAGATPGQLVLIAGRTSMGKSAWLLQWGWNAAKAGATVWYYSLEMTQEALVQRLTALETGIDLNRVTTGTMNQIERQQAAAALARADQTGLRIAYNPKVTGATIGAKLARAKTRPDLVLVDYLQLLHSSVRGSRYEQVSQISRDLKCLAVEYGVPIVAGSQLSRPEKSGDDRPQLSDLRDSGSLEQDADVVCFIHGKQADKFHAVRPVDFLIAKQRQGKLGRAELMFDGAKQRFFDPTVHSRDRDSELFDD